MIGTDADVDRRLSAVAEVDVPFYNGLKIGVPSITAITEVIAEGRYDLVHVCSPGPGGHRRLGSSPSCWSCRWSAATTPSWPPTPGCAPVMAHLEVLADYALGKFYGACDVVLSPSPATDERLEKIGVDPATIGRWDRGVDLKRFDPALRDESLLPGEINVLYAGRMTKEKGVELLADAFQAAHARDPRLHLVLAGGGPEEQALRDRLGDARDLPRLAVRRRTSPASTRAPTCSCSPAAPTPSARCVLEAQASGLPVVAVAEGGPTTLIEDGETGLLAAADPSALADAVHQIVENPLLAERLRRAALQRSAPAPGTPRCSVSPTVTASRLPKTSRAPATSPDSPTDHEPLFASCPRRIRCPAWSWMAPLSTGERS